ncbi:MAG: ABC transporter substrate-binding protein [Myxococcota bacterium]
MTENPQACAPAARWHRTMSRVMLSSLLFVSALSCATSSSHARSERQVLVDGKEIAVEDLARRRYDEAMQLRATGDVAKARALLESIRRELDDASTADFATVGLAQLFLDERRPQDAQRLLEALLLDDPTSPAAEQARYSLALAQLAQGDATAAAPTLRNLVDKLGTDEEKRQAALELSTQLRRQGQGGEAVRYLHRALSVTTDGEQRRSLESMLVQLVDTEVSFQDVRRLQELDAKPGSLLDELLTMKLARIHLHLRDHTSAVDAIERYLAVYPRGRFADDARTLRERLAARVITEPRSIGVVIPLSGPYAVYGERVLTAIKLGLGLPVEQSDYYAKQTGQTSQAGDEAGDPKDPDRRPPPREVRVSRDLSVTAAPKGTKAPPIRLIVRDSKNDPTVAEQLMQELVEQEHVVAVVGDLLLDTSLPVALKAEEYGVPVISLSRREGLPQLGSWVFRMSFTGRKQAAALAALAMETMGHRRFAILYPRHAYGIELMNAFWDEVDRRQGEVTAVESYGHDQTTFTVEAKTLVGRLNLEARGEFTECRAEANAIEDVYRRKKALERCSDVVTPLIDFDALFIPDDYRTVSYVIPALAAEDLLLTTDKFAVAAYEKTTKVTRLRPIQLLGGSMWNNEELARRLARQIDGAVMIDGFDPADQTDKVQDFVRGFAGIHRNQPGLLEAYAFDAGHLLGAILDGAGGAAPRNRSEMRTRLSTVRDFPGVTGQLSFDGDGDSATPGRFFTFKRDRIESVKVQDLAKAGDG